MFGQIFMKNDHPIRILKEICLHKLFCFLRSCPRCLHGKKPWRLLHQKPLKDGLLNSSSHEIAQNLGCLRYLGYYLRLGLHFVSFSI